MNQALRLLNKLELVINLETQNHPLPEEWSEVINKFIAGQRSLYSESEGVTCNSKAGCTECG